jgi:hypothetical protein
MPGNRRLERRPEYGRAVGIGQAAPPGQAIADGAGLLGKHERRVYLEAIRKRYRRAKRADKGKILNEFCSVCGYQRKYAIQLLGCKPATSTRRPGWPSQYNQPALLTVLRKLWLATDQMCSKGLVAVMPLWLFIH